MKSFEKLQALIMRSGVLFWGFPVLLLLLFFFTPMASILGVMISTEGEINTREIWRSFGFTIFQAAVSTLLTLAAGLPVAYVFSRFHFPGKRLMRTVTLLPFILPTVVVAAAFNALLGPRGWLNLGLMNLLNLENPPILFLNTFTAILVAHVFYNIAIVIRVVGSAWSQLDPRLEYSAQVLGASPWSTFREVTFPMLRRSILASALLVFFFDFTSFGVILMLGGPKYATLEVSIYNQVISMLNLRMAGLLSIIQLACTLGLTWLYSRVSGNQDTPFFPRLQGEGTRKPKTRAEKGLIAAVLLFVFLLQVLPIAALVTRSVTRLEADRGQRDFAGMEFTLDFYHELFINQQGSVFYVPPAKAALNSLFYAGVTIAISVTAGTMLAYALRKRKSTGRWLELLVMLPFGASAVTLGLGFIITFNRPPLDARTFPLLVPLAHSLVAMPFVYRTIQPVLSALPDSLRQSASVLGASPWRIWWDVELKIISRAVAAGAVFSFMISLGEFGATTFIARPENPTLPVAIFRYLSQPGGMNYGQAMAMATILIVICGISIYFLEKLNSVPRSE